MSFFSARRCPWSGHAVQKFRRLLGEDSSQRGVDGPLQGVRAMLAENGPLVPHFLAFIRENTEALWGQILVTTAAMKQNLNAMQFFYEFIVTLIRLDGIWETNSHTFATFEFPYEILNI